MALVLALALMACGVADREAATSPPPSPQGVSSAASAPSASAPPRSAPPSSPPDRTDPATAMVRLLAAGDIAGCEVEGDEATAALLDALEGTIAALGDLVYDRGTAEQFARCYEPSWGRHKARTRPALGNHDLQTGDGAPYYDYFGAAAGNPGEGWYAFDLSPAWRAVVLNSNCWAVGCEPGSPQHDWLVDELAAHPGRHVVAWMHHPRWASGHRGSNEFVQPLFAALADGGADVVLAGHEHHYERFTPVDAGGAPTPDGMRSFVVGTGGFALYALADDPLPTTEARSNEDFGVLVLDLGPDGYAWEFVAVGGEVTDRGRQALPVPAS